jgi:hypothetical protein
MRTTIFSRPCCATARCNRASNRTQRRTTSYQQAFQIGGQRLKVLWWASVRASRWLENLAARRYHPSTRCDWSCGHSRAPANFYFVFTPSRTCFLSQGEELPQQDFRLAKAHPPHPVVRHFEAAANVPPGRRRAAFLGTNPPDPSRRFTGCGQLVKCAPTRRLGAAGRWK